jgi:hypothetical protein
MLLDKVMPPPTFQIRLRNDVCRQKWQAIYYLNINAIKSTYLTTDSRNPWLTIIGYQSPNIVKRLRDSERMERNKRKDVTGIQN